MTEKNLVTEASLSTDNLSDVEKRRLRALRRGYRAKAAVVKNNGWQLEVEYLDGTKISVDTKLLKIKAPEIKSSQ